VKKEKIKENEKIIENFKTNFSVMILLFALIMHTFDLDKTIEKVNENKIFVGGQINQ
jgi:hypothetical protein